MSIISGTWGAIKQLKGDKSGYFYKALGLETSQWQGTNTLSKCVKEHMGTLALCGFWFRELVKKGLLWKYIHPPSHIPYKHTPRCKFETQSRSPLKIKTEFNKRARIGKILLIAFSFFSGTYNVQWKESGKLLWRKQEKELN